VKERGFESILGEEVEEGAKSMSEEERSEKHIPVIFLSAKRKNRGNKKRDLSTMNKKVEESNPSMSKTSSS